MPFGVGLIGAGTVGGGVLTTLRNNHDLIATRTGCDIQLVHVADKNLKQLDGFDLTGITVSQDANTLIADPAVNVVVELIGGLEPARTFVLRALEARKSVVTANKMLLAHHGPELNQAAQKAGVELRYEAAVAGTIPIIKSLREALVANRIKSVYGILNGTCNYILTQMTYQGLEFQAALDQAIKLGFAETPPDLDIQGHDASHKCQILASLCYSTPVDLKQMFVQGITEVTHMDVTAARELGYFIKLLAVVRETEGEIEARVHPMLVPENHLLASVRNEFNAIYVESDIADVTMYYGRGAGRMPTASAVVADVVDIARRGDAPPPPAFVYAHELPMRDMGKAFGRYYLRFMPEDQPGVLGQISTVLGKYGVSIASCSQREHNVSDRVNVVMMTHETTEANLAAAIAEIDQFAFIRAATHVLRVLA